MIEVNFDKRKKARINSGFFLLTGVVRVNLQYFSN